MDNYSKGKIICFGEVLWDMLPNGAKPGGAPLNVAIHLLRQGQSPLLISKIGNDSLGGDLMDFLTESGLNIDLIQMDERLPTSQVLVRLDEKKNASYEICEPVAWDNIQVNPKNLEAAADAGLIIFGTLASRNKKSRDTLFQILENTKANRLLDVNLRPPYDQSEIVKDLLFKADFAKLNDDELSIIASWNNKKGDEKELIQYISEVYSCPTICVTRGENGAALFMDNTLYEHPGFKVNAVDTVGAGDSFLASLIASLIKQFTPEKALETACATGAYVASQNGAVPQYSEKEINKIIFSAT